jgi:hypothetical protein
MNLNVAIFSGILFFVLSPNVFLRLPSNGSKITVAAFHAAIFGLIFFFTENIVSKLFGSVEGTGLEKCVDAKAPPR